MLRLRSIALGVISLFLLGVAGYAYLNPAFAATCKSAYVDGLTWVSQQADAAQGSFKKSRCYAAYKDGLNKSASRSQKKSQTQAAPAEGKNPLAAYAYSRTEQQLRAQSSSLSAGERIANGHAFGKHAGEFGFSEKAQMAGHINQVIGRAGGSNVRHLARGRTAYWDQGSGTVVIVDPNTADGGTSFKPGRGRKYFEGLK